MAKLRPKAAIVGSTPTPAFYAVSRRAEVLVVAWKHETHRLPGLSAPLYLRVVLLSKGNLKKDKPSVQTNTAPCVTEDIVELHG